MEIKSPVFDAIVYGLRLFFSNARLFVLAAIIVQVVRWLPYLVIGLADIALLKKHVELSVYHSIEIKDFAAYVFSGLPYTLLLFNAMTIVGLFVTAWLFAGLISMTIEYYNTGRSSLGHIFSRFDKAFATFFGLILYFIIVGIGLALFIVPGVYWLVRFSYFEYGIVDRNLGIIAAFKYSWHATRNYAWGLLAYITVMISLSKALGIWELLGIGFVVSIIIDTCIYCMFMRSVDVQKKETIAVS